MSRTLEVPDRDQAIAVLGNIWQRAVHDMLNACLSGNIYHRLCKHALLKTSIFCKKLEIDMSNAAYTTKM